MCRKCADGYKHFPPIATRKTVHLDRFCNYKQKIQKCDNKLKNVPVNDIDCLSDLNPVVAVIKLELKYMNKRRKEPQRDLKGLKKEDERRKRTDDIVLQIRIDMKHLWMEAT